MTTNGRQTEMNWATNEFLDIVLNDEYMNNAIEGMTGRDPQWDERRARQVAAIFFDGVDMQKDYNFSPHDWNDIDWEDVAAFWTDDEAVAEQMLDGYVEDDFLGVHAERAKYGNIPSDRPPF
jgi:hypothetical protein